MASAGTAAETRQASGWWRMVEKLRTLDGGYFELAPEVTPDEVRRAQGGSMALANQFREYLAVCKRDTDRIARFVRYERWDDGAHVPVFVLNEPCRALLTRTAKQLDTEWLGLCLSPAQRGELVGCLDGASDSSRRSVTAKMFYTLARDFERLPEDSALILVRQLAPVRDVIAHEQMHVWQSRHDYDPAVARKVSKSRIYQRAVVTLLGAGYFDDLLRHYSHSQDPDARDALSQLTWKEIGAHLAGGDDLELGPRSYVDSLSCRYFEAYRPEALRSIPSDSDAVREALRARGVSRRKVPVFGAVAARGSLQSAGAAY